MSLISRSCFGAGFAVAVAAMAAGTASPAAACYPVVTTAQVDQAMGAAPLKGAKLADATALRGILAEAVKRNDQRGARAIETQAMGLMGYVEGRPVSRGGCGRTWEKAN